jgi:hypothetical protein
MRRPKLNHRKPYTHAAPRCKASLPYLSCSGMQGSCWRAGLPRARHWIRRLVSNGKLGMDRIESPGITTLHNLHRQRQERDDKRGPKESTLHLTERSRPPLLRVSNSGIFSFLFFEAIHHLPLHGGGGRRKLVATFPSEWAIRPCRRRRC